MASICGKPPVLPALISPEIVSLSTVIDNDAAFAQVETFAPKLVSGGLIQDPENKDYDIDSGERNSAADSAIGEASNIDNSTTDCSDISNQNLFPPKAKVASIAAPSLADLKSDLEKLVILIASASPEQNSALQKQKLSLARTISMVDRLEKEKRSNAMRVRIGEHVALPPPDRKPRFEKLTVRKGSKRCGPREEPTERSEKGREDDWDTEVPPGNWKKKRRKLTDLEKDMEAAGLDIKVRMDILAKEDKGRRPKKKEASLWNKLKGGGPL